MTHLRVMVFEGIQNLPLLVAGQQGFFRENGLDVVIRLAPNSQVLRDGLAEGAHDIAHTAVDNALAMIEQAGHDVAIVMGGDSGFNALICRPSITSFDDIRGRTVLVDAPNTAFALVLYRILQLNGLEKSDYKIVPVGATPFRLERMAADSEVAGCIMNLPYRLMALEAGFSVMCEATDEIGAYLSTAGFIMRRWGEENRDTVTRYIRAYVQGLRWALDPEHRDETVAMVADKLKLDKDMARRAYEMAAGPNGLASDAALDRAGLQNVIDLRARLESGHSSFWLDENRFLDVSYYENALRSLSALSPMSTE